jgi:hypothetical protein
LLFFVVAVLAWFMIGSDGAVVKLIAVGIVALPLLIWLGGRLASRPESGLILMVAASAMPRGAVEIGGLNARPEHLAAGLLCVAIPLLIKHRRIAPQWMMADLALAAYIGANLFSSLFMSIAPGQTLKWSMQQVLATLPYFFFRVLAIDIKTVRLAIKAFLIAGVAEAAFGVLCFYSFLFFGTEIGVTADQYGDSPGTFGMQYEANILGSYCGACAVVLLAMYFYYRRRSLLWGYAIAFTGMLVSLSRGALGATVIAFALLLFFCARKKLLSRRVLLAAGVATLGATLIVMPALLSRFQERFSTVEVSDPTADDNTLSRVVLLAMAVDGILQHPVMGNGTASFQLHVSKEDVDFGSDVYWIGNTEIRILHDTGVVGMIFFLWFMASLAWRAARSLKQRFRPELLGLLVSAALYCVSFQFTEGTLLAFGWVHAGLMACIVLLQKPDGSNDQMELA